MVADRQSATRTAGSTAIAACGASTPATGSPASVRRPARSTPGPARSAAWHDPLGFPGLDKVAPPHQAVGAIDTRLGELEVDSVALDTEIATATEGLTGRQQEVVALSLDGALQRTLKTREVSLAERETNVARLRARRAELDDEIRALKQRRVDVEAGVPTDPRVHLHHDHHPETTGDQHYSRLVEFWSAVSVGIGLIALVALIAFTSIPVWLAITIAVLGYLLLEAAFRRRLIDLLLRLSLVMAIIGAIVLVVGYALQIVAFAVVAVAVLTLVDNVREIRSN